MADRTLQELIATVEALQATVEAQGAQLARRERGRHRGRTARRALPILLVALLVALVPLSLLAADPIFVDLGQAGEVHRADIQAIGNAGITTGFDDPTAEDPTYRLYDPTGPVTREQMASFLARTAGLGGNPPVARALTATSAGTATTAANAGNANTVGGYAPSDLARVARGEGIASVALTGLIPTGYQAVAQVTLDSPAGGFVLVSGALSLETGSNTCISSDFFGCIVYLRLRDTSVPAGPDPAEPAGVSPPMFALVNLTAHVQSVSPVYVFPVGAGSRTFALEAATVPAYANQVQARYPVITALYVPFGPTGGNTLDLP